MTKSERRDHARRIMRDAAADPASRGVTLYYGGGDEPVMTLTIVKAFYAETWSGTLSVGLWSAPECFDGEPDFGAAIDRAFRELWPEPAAALVRANIDGAAGAEGAGK